MRLPWRRPRDGDGRYRGLHRPGAVRDGRHTVQPATPPCHRMSAWLDTAPLDREQLAQLLAVEPAQAPAPELVAATEGGDGDA